MNFARTEDFFRMFHPKLKGHGSIILERRVGKSVAQSQISTLDLERISKYACGVKDIYFSTASFAGKSLLLNFARSNCLHLQVPKLEWNTNILVTLRLENKGIPLPTATIFDGQNFTFLWILDAPIENNEFYIYNLLQKGLFDAVSDFKPTKNNLDIAFLTRMVGSINGKNNKIVGLVNDYGKTYSRSYLEKAILNSIAMPITEYQKIQMQAGVTLELMSLLADRWFTAAQTPEVFNDWIIFFGSSLCNFCTKDQLFQELSAIAESLEAKPWSKIKEKYSKLIISIIQTSKDGYINFEGIHLSINEAGWRDLIKGKLSITDEEITHLHLHVLGNKSNISPHLNLQHKIIHPIGQISFVPVETLFLKCA